MSGSSFWTIPGQGLPADPHPGGTDQPSGPLDQNAVLALINQTLLNRGISGSLAPNSIPGGATFTPLATPGLVNQPINLGRTSLNPNPQDGEVGYYLADDTNGIVWTFRYRKGSSSKYKWEFVGGPPLVHENTATDALTVPYNAYQNLATSDRVTPGLAGDYTYWINVAGYDTSGAANQLNIAVNTSLIIGTTIGIATSAGASYVHTIAVNGVVNLVSTTDYVQVAYKSSTNVASSFTDRTVIVLPNRVKG